MKPTPDISIISIFKSIEGSSSDPPEPVLSKESEEQFNKRRMRKRSASGESKEDRSRISAKECRIRKKLRYQYLEELVDTSEKAVIQLKAELKDLESKCIQLDEEVGYLHN